MNPRKIYRMWLVLALLICVTLAATAAIPDTVAYVQKESNTLHNRISVAYIPPEDATVPVEIHKFIRSLGEKTIPPEGSSFALTNMTTGEVITLVSDAEGHAAAALTFTAEDVGQTYRYTLQELPGIDPSITYDDQVYDIRIWLTVDMYNRVRAEVTVMGLKTDGIRAEFVNVFDPFLVPETGDASALLFSAVMVILSAAGLLLIRKRSANQ